MFALCHKSKQYLLVALNGYLTFMYHDFMSIIQESNSEFLLDCSLGYTFNL